LCSDHFQSQLFLSSLVVSSKCCSFFLFFSFFRFFLKINTINKMIPPTINTPTIEINTPSNQ
jgi:hypothetical protein